MTRTKKLLGFRLNEPIPEWRDKFGKGGGRVIKITPLNYFDPPKYPPESSHISKIVSGSVSISFLAWEQV